MPTAHDAAPSTPPEDSDRPLTPWKNSTAKQRINRDLKDATSDIYLQIGEHTEDNFAQVNFKRISPPMPKSTSSVTSVKISNEYCVTS